MEDESIVTDQKEVADTPASDKPQFTFSVRSSIYVLFFIILLFVITLFPNIKNLGNPKILPSPSVPIISFDSAPCTAHPDIIPSIDKVMADPQNVCYLDISSDNDLSMLAT